MTKFFISAHISTTLDMIKLFDHFLYNHRNKSQRCVFVLKIYYLSRCLCSFYLKQQQKKRADLGCG